MQVYVARQIGSENADPAKRVEVAEGEPLIKIIAVYDDARTAVSRSMQAAGSDDFSRFAGAEDREAAVVLGMLAVDGDEEGPAQILSSGGQGYLFCGNQATIEIEAYPVLNVYGEEGAVR